ncbi:HAD-IIB family hydrolase [Paeniglutamicibacter antarcticus]|uniref:HAD family hydrolase n=1 Tax=Paeniglutamicibacter antarcticus TaxID=494023 RepID=A0ABP9TEZ2_9MICC
MQEKRFPATRRIHAVFLDVDGTYADYGVVPQANANAVRAARDAGHKVLLCTGRPLSMLQESILAAGFDGLVTSAGAYVEVAGEVLRDRRFPVGLASRTVASLDSHDAVYVLESQESLHVRSEVLERLRSIIEGHFNQRGADGENGARAILDSIKPFSADTGFSKVSVFDSSIPVGEIAGGIGQEIAAVENSIVSEGLHTGELFMKGISKADGVAVAIAALGITQKDTIAIGDGENDLEMVAFAGIGVAIEGSHPGLVALADRTAPPPELNGIAVAFKALGLI